MKLLIVDDDIPTTQAVRNCVLAMSELTFDVVETAYNVVTAKEMIQEEQYDIVICDIEMPRYSGMDLLEWVREQGERRNSSSSHVTRAFTTRRRPSAIKPRHISSSRWIMKR